MKEPFSSGLDETVAYLGWLDMFLAAFTDESADMDEVRTGLRKEAAYLAKRTADTAGIPMQLSDGISISNVASIFGIKDFTFFCLLLVIAPQMDEHYLDIYESITSGSGDFRGITLGLAEDLYSLMAEGEELLEARRALSFISSCPVFSVTGDDNSVLCDRISLNRQLAGLIKGDLDFDYSLSKIAREEIGTDAGILAYISESEALSNYLAATADSERNTLVSIGGVEGSGRKELIKHVIGSENAALFINFHRLMLLDAKALHSEMENIVVRCAVCGMIPVVTQIDESEYRELSLFADNLFRFFPLVFITVSDSAKYNPDNLDCDVYRVSLTMPKALYRKYIWTDKLSPYKLSKDVDIQEIATKYHLYPGKIKECADCAAAFAASKNSDVITADIITDAILSLTTSKLDELGDRIPLKFTWDDLYIEDSQKAVIKTLISRVKSQSIVDEEWGFDEKVPYGKGLSIILYGSPGTGKTMAAQVMAKEIGMALYRIDLSRLVDKYIGETEKNISRVFDAASDGNVILFFDEADALFANRTEVKSSNDKHANTEIAFLLQKMEAFDGITILATNRFNNFDKAFLRRITYAARLERPDAAARLLLYNKILPEKTPKDKGLDLEFFANEFELSGSEIKEVLYSAAAMAAGDSGILSNKHMVRAIRYQQEKTGNLIPPETFGRYSSLV